MAIQGLTDNMIDNIATGSEAEAEAMMDAFEKANFQNAVDGAVADAGFEAGVLDGAQNLKMSGNINGFNFNYDLTMTADQVAQYKALSDAAASAETFSPEYYKAAGELHGFLATTQQANENLTALARTIKEIPKDMLTSDQIEQAIAVLDNADEAIEKIMDIGGPTAAAAQGALATVDDNNKEMHKVKPIDPKEKEQLELDLKGGGDKKESLSMEDRFEMFLMEKDPAQGELPLDNPNTMAAKAKRGIGSALGKVGGAIKKGAGAAVGAAKSAGKELGNKVTYNKLMKSWKDAGSPTDSASVMNILQDAGLSNDQITTIGKENKVDLKPKAQPKADATTATPQAGGTQAQGGDAPAQTGNPQADAPAQSQPAGNAEVKPSTIKKGQTMKANDGNEYKWMGALWVNTATNKPIGIMPSMKAGLPNPKLDPIIAAAKKDPKLAKLIKQQIASKGVEAGSAGAQKAAQAGVKGTEKLDAKGVTK
jgi:hypothetical protein